MTYDTEQLEEVAVLGAMLLVERSPWPEEVLALRPEFFESSRHASVFAAMQELIDDGELVDEITVSAKLKSYGKDGQFVYLNTLAEECPTTVNLGHWAQLLLEKGRQRLLTQEIQKLQGAGLDSAELAIRLREAVNRVEGQTSLVHGLEPVRAHVGAELKRLATEAESDANAVRIKTGLKKLDAKVHLRPGQLTVVAGRPGMGKSALAGTIAANVSKRIDSAVALFSLEMSRTDYIRRLLAGEACCSTHQLAELHAKGELVEHAAALYDLDLWVDERPRLTVSEIRATVQRRLPRCRLLVVDYLQLTNMGKGTERHDLQVGEATKGLRAIAKDFDCHVMVLSQLNRNVEKRTPPIPQLSDLRDSGNIEEDADHVWLLYRPGYYEKQKDDNGGPAPDLTKSQIIVAKQRGGPTARLGMRFRPEQARFEDAE